MHPWQTLTLARVECGLGDMAPRSFVESVKDFLLKIGYRYFPEPIVSWSGSTVASQVCVCLTWTADDRSWQVSFQPDQQTLGQYIQGSRPIAAQFPCGEKDGIKSDVTWLMFGGEPERLTTAPEAGESEQRGRDELIAAIKSRGANREPARL